MRRFLFFGSLVALVFAGCEKVSDNNEKTITAESVGYNLNCSTCILTFPYDSRTIQKSLGYSRDNLYEAVNLKKGNYETGQMLKVKVRAAVGDEIPVCIAMYPTGNYLPVYVTEPIKSTIIKYNTPVCLGYGDYLYDPEKNIYMCFDSVLSDSRCPKGAMCIWAGEATARFKFSGSMEGPAKADILLGATDYPVDDYLISFRELNPYPSLDYFPEQKDYIATIVIKKDL